MRREFLFALAGAAGLFGFLWSGQRLGSFVMVDLSQSAGEISERILNSGYVPAATASHNLDTAIPPDLKRAVASGFLV
jgi:hypothetical protein